MNNFNDERFIVIQQAVDIVVAHVKSNRVPLSELAPFIKNIYNHLAGKENNQITPSVPVEESIKNDYLICLEDGKQLKTLKRHLRTTFNMTPEQYRAKWGLPSEYPMVAPKYAERRSMLAKGIGLGKYKR